MEEGASERKDDKNEKFDEVKEAEYPDGTPPDDTEEGVSERKDDKNDKKKGKRGRIPRWHSS